VVLGRDVHWLIRSRSPETTLGPKLWLQALPDNPTTARNTTMLARLADILYGPPSGLSGVPNIPDRG
jgi:hypothetical protein